MNKLTIILVLTFASVFGQKAKSDFEISGQVKVYFGQELLIPKDATVELRPSFDIKVVDSLGFYKFSGLKSGSYELRVLDFNFEPEFFHIEIVNQSAQNFDLYVTADCEINKQIAESDLKNENPKLILIGGIAPIVDFEDGKFANKYGIQFYDYGCTPPPLECVYQYNNVIFEYLDNKFGKKWREEVRQDVIGLK
ncbi:hypothetical protein ACFQ1R_13050 [Mariniflexile jejuense]|uniref:Carboxypeptidase regulatory-like domain-containing protein n=1 Tax=Mariniflexile jejuense TaxID=1173582 RepID=A0ABW3JKV2_9FLAO